MIPLEIQERIFPEIAGGSADAVILSHCCGVDFQFYVDRDDGDKFVVTLQHLKSWSVELKEVAAVAGDNCFQYNTFETEVDGVFHDYDRNMCALLFAPGTFIEHNSVEGRPLLLVISETECILTGSQSEVGKSILEEKLKESIASAVVTIDSEWRAWILEVDV